MKKIYLALLFSVLAVYGYGQGCTDLFFSEYVEGSSNNKAIEIYNPTSSAINLSSYRVYLNNLASPTGVDSFRLSGTLAAGDVYVIANPSANATIQSVKDDTSRVTFYNGDDALALVKGVNDTLDIFGTWGSDPGTAWVVDTGSSQNYTLVRKPTVNAGTKNWVLSASSQWIALPIDRLDSLGKHTMRPCAAITDTIISFVGSALTVPEVAGVQTIGVTLNTSSATVTRTATVVLKSGTSADINGFTSQLVTIPAGSTSTNLSITITDDATYEPLETLVFALRSPSGTTVIGTDSLFSLRISENDIPTPEYPIGTLTTVNATTGSVDSNNVRCWVRGVVHGVNLRASTTGMQFTVIDATGGIGVFSPASTFGYTVNQGDSVQVRGTVTQFNGLTQLGFVDTVIRLGSGLVRTPLAVTDLSEATESEIVKINNVTLVTPSQWDGSISGGFTCDISNGTKTFQMRIDNDVDLYSRPRPVGRFNVAGIGSQFDATSPYLQGYQILPRYVADIEELNSIEGIGSINVQLSVYPNPSSNVLTLVCNNESDDKTVSLQILSVDGKVVMSNSYDIKNGENNILIQTNTLSKGTYFIQLSGNSISGVSRFVKN